MLYSTIYYLNHATMTLYAAWEILNPFPQSELAQPLSFTNLCCRIVSKISQVHCDYVLYFIVLMFQCFNVSCIIQHLRNKPFFIRNIENSWSRDGAISLLPWPAWDYMYHHIEIFIAYRCVAGPLPRSKCLPGRGCLSKTSTISRFSTQNAPCNRPINVCLYTHCLSMWKNANAKSWCRHQDLTNLT